MVVVVFFNRIIYRIAHDVFGCLTDRWGLTTSVIDDKGNVNSREFNPRFTFTYHESTTQQESSRTFPTILKIGGDLHIVGDIVKLLDGKAIDAQNISINT